MKKTIIAAIIVMLSVGSFAQNIETAKKAFDKGDLSTAKTQIDAYVSSNATNPMGYFLKAKVYEALTASATLSGIVPNSGEVAFESFKKGMELANGNKEVTLEMLKDKNFYNSLLNLYNDYYNRGIKAFNAGSASHNPADFSNSVDAFIMANNVGKWAVGNKIPTTLSLLDTALVLDIGQAAINAQKSDVAEFYFKQLADANVSGTKDGSAGFNLPYQWLAQYYRDKKDDANFNNYVNKGRQLFPNDQYFDGVMLDYYGAKKDYPNLFKKYDEMNTRYPDSARYNINYSAEVIGYIYGSDEGVKIENKDLLLNNLRTRLERTLKREPDNIRANWIMGQYFYNLGIDARQKALAIKAPKLPADIKAKADLNATAKGYFNSAVPYVEKAIVTLEVNNKKTDKSTYKTIVNLASQVYEQLQQPDKVKFYQTKYDNADSKFVN
ncbi:MAG: hypothetical protein NVSMB45_18020 [Ginsengibacter sp.]